MGIVLKVFLDIIESTELNNLKFSIAMSPYKEEQEQWITKLT